MTAEARRERGESETRIQRDIMLALGRLPGVIVYRNSVGVAEYDDRETGVRRKVRYGLAPGTPDLVVIDAGRIVGLEVKSETGVPEESQLDVQKQWHAVGTFYGFVRSVDEARAALERARAGGLA